MSKNNIILKEIDKKKRILSIKGNRDYHAEGIVEINRDQSIDIIITKYHYSDNYLRKKLRKLAVDEGLGVLNTITLMNTNPGNLLYVIYDGIEYQPGDAKIFPVNTDNYWYQNSVRCTPQSIAYETKGVFVKTHLDASCDGNTGKRDFHIFKFTL